MLAYNSRDSELLIEEVVKAKCSISAYNSRYLCLFIEAKDLPAFNAVPTTVGIQYPL